MRLFVAVSPPEEVRSDLVRRYDDAIPRARWVKKDQLHVTLRFIGEVEEEVAKAVQVSLRAVSHPPLSLRIAGLGTFGRPARVIWAGLEPQAPLVELAARVEAAVVEAGLEPEKRPFSPHLTVARLKNSPPIQIRRFLERHQELNGAPFTIGEMVLYSSVLSSSGATHSVVERYPLAAEASV